jgi:hypothetical protein
VLGIIDQLLCHEVSACFTKKRHETNLSI